MKRACVIRQHHVPLDPRVWREANALAEIFDTVDVICMRGADEPWIERTGQLRVYRLPISHRRGGKLRYLFEYAAFMLMAFALVTALFVVRRYRLVQVHSMPDSLVFAAAVPRLLGARVVLDLQEPMPEFFRSKFGGSPGSLLVRLVSRVEQLAIRFAHLVITPTRQMRATFIERGGEPSKIHVVMNGSDEEIFSPVRLPSREFSNGQFRLICHGSVEERYGLDTVIRALPALRRELPGIRFQIIGRGSYRNHLIALARDFDVYDLVEFSDGFLPEDELVAALTHADAGVVAMKRDDFRDRTLCLKMFDFIAMGLPVISSRTTAVVDYFGENCFALFESDDADDLARKVIELYRRPDRGAGLAVAASAAFEPYRWPKQRREYLGLVSRLIAGHQDASAARSPGLPIGGSG